MHVFLDLHPSSQTKQSHADQMTAAVPGAQSLCPPVKVQS